MFQKLISQRTEKARVARYIVLPASGNICNNTHTDMNYVVRYSLAELRRAAQFDLSAVIRLRLWLVVISLF